MTARDSDRSTSRRARHVDVSESHSQKYEQDLMAKNNKIYLLSTKNNFFDPLKHGGSPIFTVR